MKYLFYISAVCIVFFSCKKGEETITQHDYSGFNTIHINHEFDINLVEDSDSYVLVKCPERFREGVQIEQNDTILSFDYEKKNRWLHPRDEIVIEIHAPSFKQILSNETSDITCLTPLTGDQIGLIMKGKAGNANLNLNCNTFYYWNQHPTGGVVKLKGQTQLLKIWNYAITTVEAKELTTYKALVENESQGDCTVTVTDILHYTILGSGNIQAYGSPNELYNEGVTSSGELILH